MKSIQIALKMALVGAAGLLAAACLPVTSKAPIGTTAGLGADPALAGAWKAVPKPDSKGTDYLHFLANSKAGMTVLIVSHEAGKDNSGWSEYHVTTATLNGHHYMNALAVRSGDKPVEDASAHRNTPLLYTLSKDGRTLALYLIDEDAAKAAIKAGKIAGKIDPGNYGDVVLTASAKKLDAFFARKDAPSMFEKKPLVVMTKLE